MRQSDDPSRPPGDAPVRWSHPQWDDFLRRHWRQLHKTISRHSALRPQDRDDILSDALSAVWRKRDKLDPKKSLFNLIITIAVRRGRAVSAAQARSREQPLPDDLREDRPSGPELLEANERREAAQDYLDRLDPTDRAILVGRHVEGVTWDDLAGRVRRPRTSVVRRHEVLLAGAQRKLAVRTS